MPRYPYNDQLSEKSQLIEKRKRKDTWKRKLEQLVKRDGLNCYWCGRRCSFALNKNADLSPTRDHLVRRADGGSNSLSNLVLACRKCNNSRHGPNWKPPLGLTLS